MDVNEVSQFIDQLVVEHTGKHLDDIQKAVVEGAWQRHTYKEISKKCHVTEGHAADAGADLWQLLSDALGEDIKKSNFRSHLERVYIKSSQNICIGTNHHFTFNPLTDQIAKQNTQKEDDTQRTVLCRDLNIAPLIIQFYNRELEAKTLTALLSDEKVNLISVLGLSGIGKTVLVKRFIDVNSDQFEVIIWKSLKSAKNLSLLIDDILALFKEDKSEDSIKKLFEIFTQKKCLLVLDDVQEIFVQGTFAGKYKPEYQAYQNFFQRIVETEHQSHVILISQEQCPEMKSLDEELYPIKTLELSGIEETDILQNTRLKDENCWLQLVKAYEGNPQYLKDITFLIKDVFDGNVAEFLAENNLLLTTTIQNKFEQLFNRLSTAEKQLCLQCSHLSKPVSREELKENLALSSSDLINGLQSLQKRYLITGIKGDRILFFLSPLFAEYLNNYQSCDG